MNPSLSYVIDDKCSLFTVVLQVNINIVVLQYQVLVTRIRSMVDLTSCDHLDIAKCLRLRVCHFPYLLSIEIDSVIKLDVDIHNYEL